MRKSQKCFLLLSQHCINYLNHALNTKINDFYKFIKILFRSMKKFYWKNTHDLSNISLCDSTLELLFSIYFLCCYWWINSSSIKQEKQKMNRLLPAINLDFFKQNPYIFLQIQLLYESTFFMKLSLLLNKSITWQWLLFDLA